MTRTKSSEAANARATCVVLWRRVADETPASETASKLLRCDVYDVLCVEPGQQS